MTDVTPTTERALPLAQWLWRSYIRTAIIPLLAIELSFLAIYWIGNAVIYDRNAGAIERISTDQMERIAQREAVAIGETLTGVANLTRVYAAETREALATPHDPPAMEAERYAFSADGVYHTTRDIGTTASFYSGVMPIGPEQIDKVRRTAQLDPLMKNIKDSSPLIAQIYFNSYDSYNRIYPYFDVLSQYAPKMDIPSFNFYYEADAEHNPGRDAVWTDAYIDPAGAGWMVSSIAPVYGETRLEGVVGIDVTIQTIVDRVLDLDLPWQGYAVLVGRDGTILALPERGEEDWGLREKTTHHYDEAIRQNVFKPDDFNILRRPDSQPLAAALTAGERGVIGLDLGEAVVTAWSRVPGPGWHLLVIAPRAEILADAEALRGELSTVGFAMVAILLAFYLGFFAVLYRRARVMSQRVARPLEAIAALITRIGDGAYQQAAPRFAVSELNTVGSRLVDMGHRLGSAHDRLVESESTVRTALERERGVNVLQRRFIDVVSHEFRTPLTIIDGVGQALERRADRMTPERLVENGRTLRSAVQRTTTVVDSVLNVTRLEENAASIRLTAVEDVGGVVADACEAVRQTFPGRAATLSAPAPVPAVCDTAMVRIACIAVLDNALRYSPPDTGVEVTVGREDGWARIDITDHGHGIPAEDLPRLFERFTRGSGAMTSHGAGLGLHLVRTLLQAHGGTITVASAAGRGTTVTLRLPQEPIRAGANTSEAA